MLNDNCMTDNVPPLLLCVEELTKCSKPMEEEFFDAYERTFLCREQVNGKMTSCGQGVQAPLFQHLEDEDEDDHEEETVISMDSFYSSIASSVESISTLAYLCGARQLIDTIQKGPICGDEKEEEELSQSDDDCTDISSVVTLQHTSPNFKVGVKVNSTPTKRTHWFPVLKNPLEVIREKEPSLYYLPFEIHKGFKPPSEGERKSKVNLNGYTAKSSFRMKRSTHLGIMPQKNSNDSSMFSTRSATGTISNDSSKFSTSAPSLSNSNDSSMSYTTTSTPVSSMLSIADDAGEKLPIADDAEEKVPPNSKMFLSATAIDLSVVSALGSYASVGQYVNKDGKEGVAKHLPHEIAVQTRSKPCPIEEIVENKDNSSSCSGRIYPADRSLTKEDHSISKALINDEVHLVATNSYDRPSSTGGDSRNAFQQDDASPRSVILPPPKTSLPKSKNICKYREESNHNTARFDVINTPVEKTHSSAGSNGAPISHGSITTNNQPVRSSDSNNGKEDSSVRSFEKISNNLSTMLYDDANHVKEQPIVTCKLPDNGSPLGPNSAENSIPAKIHGIHELEESGGIINTSIGSEQSTKSKNPLSGAIKSTLREQIQPATEDSQSIAQHSRNSSFDSLILISYEDIDKIASSNHKREEVNSTSLESFASPTVAATEEKTDGNDFTSFLMKYSSTMANDTNNLKPIQTHAEADNVKPKQVNVSHKMLHQRNIRSSENENRDEREESSKFSIYTSYNRSHVHENAAILLNTTSPKSELDRKDERLVSPRQSGSTERRKENKLPKQDQPFVRSETAVPYFSQINPFTERPLLERSKNKKNKSSQRSSKGNHPKSNENDQHVENLNASTRYFIDAKNNDEAIVHSHVDQTDYRQVEEEDSFNRHVNTAYKLGPDKGVSQLQPFDPFDSSQDEQTRSAAVTNFPFEHYFSASPIHDSMRHTRHYEDQSVGKMGRNGVFDLSSTDYRVKSPANPKNKNFIRGENGNADIGHVILPNTKQALASSSPYLDNHDDQFQSFHLKQHLGFENFQPTHVLPQGIKGRKSVLQREDSEPQHGGVSLHSKSIIEDFRGRPISDSHDFVTHIMGNHGEKTTNYFSGVEAKNESNVRKQRLFNVKGTAAKIETNETSLMFQRSLEYAQTLSKPKESNVLKSFKDSRLHQDYLTQQSETERRNFSPDSQERVQYTFGYEPIKESLVESLVKRKAKVAADQYKYEPELVQTYSTKIDKRAVKSGNNFPILSGLQYHS